MERFTSAILRTALVLVDHPDGSRTLDLTKFNDYSIPEA